MEQAPRVSVPPTTKLNNICARKLADNTNGLAAGATNAFHFVITSDKSITTANLNAKVSVTRIVLEGGKLADVSKDVTMTVSP